MSININDVNNLGAQQFIELLGGIFEHSPWVAERVYPQRPFEMREALHRAMAGEVGRAPRAQRLELLCSHPELAGKEAHAGTLTNESFHEQAGAGLNQCSAGELMKIKSLNQAYLDKFGFPFIIAVTGLDKFQIIAMMEQRLGNGKAQEFNTAIGEVEKIGRIRIDALIDG